MRDSVALIIDELEVGGSQRQLYLTATGLSARGWRVEVICLQPILAMERDFREAGISVHLILKKRQIDLQLVWALRQFLVRHGIGVVHAFSSTAEFYGSVAARLAGARFIGSIRNAAGPLPLLHRVGKRTADRLADAVIANARAGRDDAIDRRLVSERKVHVIPNGLDVKRFTVGDGERLKARLRFGVPLDAPVIVSVGRLVVQKGWDTIVDVAREVMATHPTAVFIAVGDGPLREAIDAHVTARAIGSRFIRIGECRDIRPALFAGDIYLHASRWEGMSNSIMEAMAAGLPVVASAIGGTPELVTDGTTGLLFPVDDVRAATERLCALIADPDLRRRLGARGRSLIETRYSANAMVSSVDGLYRALLCGSAT